MEYSLISFDEYKNCKNIAKRILRDSAQYSHKDINKLRAPDIINMLNSKYSPNVAIYYSDHVGITDGSTYMDRMNEYFDIKGIYMRVRRSIKLDDIFVETVSGMTAFNNGQKPVMFLNINNYFNRMLFTMLHEFTHMYQAENRSADYMQALAMINRDKMSGNSYSDELKPVEDEANTVASLLLLPDHQIDKEIRVLSYDTLRSKYNMSCAGLFNRLRSYFYYDKGLDEYEASQVLYAFRLHKPEFATYIKKYLD